MDTKSHQTLTHLLVNSRFYIVALSLLLSLAIAGWLRLIVASDVLFYIRLEQVFGFISLGYLYVALLISPLVQLLPNQQVSNHLAFARRAIGVGAAYFGLLHIMVATWGQLAGPGQLLSLPNRFAFALLLGMVSFVILAIMAVTSFDKAISILSFPRWKRIHRFVYVAGVFIMLHVWLIGTHVSYSAINVGLSTLFAVLLALESLRLMTKLQKPVPWLQQNGWQLYAATLVLIGLWTTLLLIVAAALGPYTDTTASVHLITNVENLC